MYSSAALFRDADKEREREREREREETTTVSFQSTNYKVSSSHRCVMPNPCPPLLYYKLLPPRNKEAVSDEEKNSNSIFERLFGYLDKNAQLWHTQG